MQPAIRFRWDTPEYAEAFAALLRCSGEREHVHRFLRETFARLPKEGCAVDFGAGGGDLTRVLLAHFQRVYAVEPNPALRAELRANCPGVRLLDGTLATAAPPEPIDLGLISHVLYHVPDHKWGAYVVGAARHLSERGVLLVSLKDPDSGCNRMLERFGAPRFHLVGRLSEALAHHPEFRFGFTRLPGNFRTQSFAETLAIARLMLADRDEDSFSRPATEDGFQAYAREHFWNEAAGTGGWDYDVVLAAVERNPSYG